MSLQYFTGLISALFHSPFIKKIKKKNKFGAGIL